MLYLAGNARPIYWFLGWSALVLLLKLTDLNVVIFQYINSITSIVPGVYWAYLTNIGDTVYIICLFLPLITRYPRLAIPFWLTLIFGGLFVQLLKLWLAAPRPPAVLGIENINIYGPAHMTKSFPSGHSFAIWSAVAITSSIIKDRRYIYILMAIATLVAVSRIAVGVHWPIDVIAGSVMGWYFGCFTVMLNIRKKILNSPYLYLVTLLLLSILVLTMYDYDNGYPETRYLHYVVATLSLGFTLKFIIHKFKTRTLI